jgi:hypothetical protein
MILDEIFERPVNNDGIRADVLLKLKTDPRRQIPHRRRDRSDDRRPDARHLRLSDCVAHAVHAGAVECGN